MRRAWSAAALAIFLVLAFVLFASAWQAPAGRIIGSHGDPLVYVWFLEWFPYALGHGLSPFITDFINYPQGANILWNTPMPLASLVASPVTLSAGPVVAYNLFVTLALALSAWTAFLAASRYLRNRVAALACGLVYGFSPLMVTQAVGHWHVVMAWTPPLVLLLVDELAVRQSRPAWKIGALLGGLGLVQLLLGEELLTTEVLTAGVGLGLLALLHRGEVRGRLPYVARGLAVGAAIFLPLSLVVVVPQFFGPGRITGVIQPRNYYLTDLLNFVVPTRFQWLAPGWALRVSDGFSGNGSEINGYLGVTLVLACAYTAFRHWRAPFVRFIALLGAAMAVLSLGPRLHVAGHDTLLRLPYWVIDHTPVLANLLPNRLALYVALCAGLLLGYLLDDLAQSQRRGRRVLAALVLVAALAPLLPAWPYMSSPTTTPAFFTSAAVRRVKAGDVVLVSPYSSTPAAPDPMLWQAEARMRFRMPEAYIFTPDATGHARLGPAPTALSARLERIAHFPTRTHQYDTATRADFLADMRRYRVSDVVVGPMNYEAETVAFFTDLLGRPPEYVGGVYVWWDVGGAESVR